MTTLNESLRAVYEERMVSVRDLSKMEGHILTNRRFCKLPSARCTCKIDRRTRVVALGAIHIAMLLLGWRLIHSIARPLERVIDNFRQISLRHYDSPIRIDGSDEISRVMQALKTMQTKLGIDESALHELSFYDPLTKLPNRRLLRDRPQLALNVSARNGLYGAILMLDLDNFKVFNDTKNHDVGDILLVVMGERIKGCLR